MLSTKSIVLIKQPGGKSNGANYGSISPPSAVPRTLVRSPARSEGEGRPRVWNQGTQIATRLLLVALIVCGLVAWSHHASLSPHANMAKANLVSGLKRAHKDGKIVDSSDDPSTPLYFSQIVDHNHPHSSGTFDQRYYVDKTYWEGPGHPIFIIFGGEGPLERILYPFISVVLARTFGAVTFNLEHRYFGESYPVKKYSKHEIATQLTPRQALQDMVVFIQAKQDELGCGPRGSPDYCPVMTVGGSYAGLLSTLIRKAYPDVVDMAYSASPCLFLFSHMVTPYVYYEQVTTVAERISPGCHQAVRSSLEQLRSDLEPISSRRQLKKAAEKYGVCSNLPPHIKTGSDLAEEITLYTAAQFISDNMDYYPPSPDQKFFEGCSIFEDDSKTLAERVRGYFEMSSGNNDCHDLHPTDWTPDDASWDALCCYLVPMIGKSNDTMWPAAPFSVDSDVSNCQDQFGITLDTNYLDKEFGLSDLTDVSRLLLTNGYNDGWFPLSYNEPIPGVEGVVIFNMENGAHHSDLTHQLQADTPDVELVHLEISQLLSQWLDEIRQE